MDHAASEPAAASPVAFEAVIIPHRSLGPEGFRMLVGFIVLVSLGISVGLWCIGAWPAAGFDVTEITIAILLLRRNARATRASEMLLLSDDGLRVVRTDHAGRRTERTLQSAWLRTDLEERPGRTPALWLANRGMRMEVGAELGEAEKRDLAEALNLALHRHRNPVFDNPQLR